MSFSKSKIQELRSQLLILRERRKRNTLCIKAGILLTEKDLEVYRKEHCPTCGKKLYQPRLYFGELFCGDCVEQMLHGKK